MTSFHLTGLAPKNSTFLRLVHKLKAYVTLKQLLFKALAANDNDICESSINTSCKHESTQISPVVKMRWKQLARNAFNHSVDQKVKQQTNATVEYNQNGLKSQTKTLGSNVKSFLNKNNLINLIARNAPTTERVDDWVQLSGHEDSFAMAGPGTIWKKRSGDSAEVQVYEMLMNEPISEMIPKFYRNVTYKGDNFIELEDLLYHYKDASIMDIKMGSRTFLESEVNSNKARHDLYEKMIKIDPHEPTEEEHMTQSVTKLRYMQFREDLSSTSNLGFRIEGFKVGNDLKHNKNLHMIKRKDEVQHVLSSFFANKPDACNTVVNRLRKLRKHFENSNFFQKHQVIGSSILIIYTEEKAGVWMIDFAKTLPVPDNIEINHRRSWSLGNHEDGYLFGLDNLISVLDDVAHES